MKIIGRVLIILAVFSTLSGLMVLAVNANGSSASDFDGTRPQFALEEGREGEFIRPEGGEFNPESGQVRPERGEGGDPGGGSRWMFGMVKNVSVMAVLVTLIVLPRSFAKKKKRQAAINSANGMT
jgi:hypothetical protein